MMKEKTKWKTTFSKWQESSDGPFTIATYIVIGLSFMIDFKILMMLL